ncbi:MAG: phosphodiester glycosidase family protein [Candidatus Gottesmanbacteria bacterium]
MEKRKCNKMKRLVIVLACCLFITVGIFVGLRILGSSPSTSSIIPFLTATPTEEIKSTIPQVQEVVFNSISYAFDTFDISDVSKLRLIGNFTEKKTTKQIMEDNGCIFGVNAGFYSTDNTPLGLFIGENYQQQTPINSALFNGYLSFNKITGDISSKPPNYKYVSAIQSGPLLFVNGVQQFLSIQDDTHERRVVAIITKEQNLIFIIIYTKDSLYQGPLLGNLPKLLSQISNQLDSPIRDAINLDGGSASTFLSESINIQELTSVGSMFCLTK